jgi:fructose-1,6-bisphosphatase I
MNLGTTVVEHLLISQRATPMATGAFTRLLNAIIVAAKVVGREVNHAGLVDILGATGRSNVSGDQVQKLDEFANATFTRRLGTSGEVCIMASEEDADVVDVPRHYPKGHYAVIFDPLDGSSNIDANVSIGTIFSIYRRVSPNEGESGTLEDLLQPGHKQVAAGYVIYGSSTVLVYSAGNGVHGFTLDPSVGEFLLSHENIQIPEYGKIFSINEGNYSYWEENVRRYIDYLKDPEGDHRKSYTSRYIGSLVADFHRNLLYGGIFLYPKDFKNPRKSTGKLRLTCEASPMAFIAEQAGGMATTGEERIMDLVPQELHQRVPLIVGSKGDVETFLEFYQGRK